MFAITIGYAEKGHKAQPVVLYAGTDAGVADDLSLNPPAGIISTLLFKNPPVIRRRTFAAPEVAPLVLEAEPAATPEAPAEEKPKASSKVK